MDWAFGLVSDRQRRLYRRNAAKFSGIVHESSRFTGKPGRIGGDIFHYTINSFAEHKDKVEHYSTLAAQQMLESGRRNWRTGMWLASPWAGFRSYVLAVDSWMGIAAC